MVTKSAGLLMDDIDNMKQTTLRTTLFETWAISIQNYEQQNAIQTRIMQNLREEHLAEHMALFLDLAITKYNAITITEKLFKDIKDIHYNDKDLKLSKAMSSFLVSFSSLQPKIVIKQMIYLQDQLESESYTIRMGMMEVFMHLIQFLFNSESNQNTISQIEAYFEIFQLRIHDVNSYVRSKVLQCLIKLAE